MPKELPVPDAPFSTISVVLSGQSYTVKFYWNEQNNFWCISMYTSSGIAIVEGFAIMANSCISYSWGYIAQSSNPLFGAIYCINTNDSEAPLNRYSFGKTSMIVYYTALELQSSNVS